MKQLYRTTILIYIALITSLSCYLFLGKITIGEMYPISIKKNPIDELHKAILPQATITIHMNKGFVLDRQKSDAYAIKYTALQNGVKSTITENCFLKNSHLNQDSVYDVTFPKKEISLNISKQIVFDTFIIIRRKQTIFSALEKSIINPFKK